MMQENIIGNVIAGQRYMSGEYKEGCTIAGLVGYKCVCNGHVAADSRS